jgi:hypothetical protein
MRLMADPKKKPDRHVKKALQLRIHPVVRAQLEKLVELSAGTLTTEITIAIRERLAAAGLWPPK